MLAGVAVLLWTDSLIRTDEMVGNGDVAAETHQVLKNLVAVLKQAGATPAQVVRTTIFLADLGDFQTVNGVYAEVFGDGSAQPEPAFKWQLCPKDHGEIDWSLGWAADAPRGQVGTGQWSYAQAKLTIGELEAGYPMYCKALRRLLQQENSRRYAPQLGTSGNVEPLPSHPLQISSTCWPSSAAIWKSPRRIEAEQLSVFPFVSRRTLQFRLKEPLNQDEALS